MSSAEPQMSEAQSVIRAAMDIGSNSIKLLVLEFSPDGGYQVLADRSRVTGLGRGVSSSGELSAQAVADTLACIRELAAEARALGAREIRAAATAAMRSASNPQAVLDPLRDELGIHARVISGDEEAALSRAVSLRELSRLSAVDSEREAVFFDLGGGSTELTRI